MAERCLDTGDEILTSEGQCAGCYLECQPAPCVSTHTAESDRAA